MEPKCLLTEWIGKRGRIQRSKKEILNWEHVYELQVLCKYKYEFKY